MRYLESAFETSAIVGRCNNHEIVTWENLFRAQTVHWVLTLAGSSCQHDSMRAITSLGTSANTTIRGKRTLKEIMIDLPSPRACDGGRRFRKATLAANAASDNEPVICKILT
jgi:hypothetical protein